jgi:glycosyltransferase involved in cell wall biosynthesis
MKTAIVHEWLTTYAGSERCVESFTNLYPDADLFVLFNFLNKEDLEIIAKGKMPATSFIQKLPFAKSNARKYLALFPLAVEQFDLSEYDLIISSSHAVAKGVLTNSNQLHIRMWDISTANRPDYYIANSNYIAARINKIYNREAIVINPPVDINKFEFCDKKDDYYLTAARFVPYKRVDIIAEAFSLMPGKRLIIVGDGPDEEKVKSKSAKNVEFVGYQTGEKLKYLFKNAKAFVFAAEEDFGITVIEAMASGTPIIALNKGGTAETVIDSVNGIHFNEQNALSIKKAVERFESKESSFNHAAIAEYAKQFDRRIFEAKIKNFIEEKLKEKFYKS